MKGIRDDLISVSNVVKQLGYTLILKPDDPECIPPCYCGLLYSGCGPEVSWEIPAVAYSPVYFRQ
jgi:hypothetical protein